MMKNEKIFIISIILIIIIGILFAIYISKPKQITSIPSPPNTKSDITISTDKNEYSKGENINIIVENGLKKDILYSPGGDRFWDIEYYEEDEWKKFGYQDRDEFQLTNKNVGTNCYIALYELSYPAKLQPKSNITSQWNQIICPFGKEGPSTPQIVKYIESGKYRLVFQYGFKIHDNDPFQILEPKTVYSNTFTIR